MSDAPSEFDPLEELADSFLERYRRGERPSLSEYARRHPELADQIRELFPALVVVEELGSVDSARPAAKLDASRIPRQLGEYSILREIGRGGMGIVYEAVQESLGRHVALKVLPFHELLSPAHLERFRREARAAARLHHTNIVPVFGVGEHEGIHYYAMQFIHGQGLHEVLQEVKRLRAHRQHAIPSKHPLAVSVAETMLQGAAADLVSAQAAPADAASKESYSGEGYSQPAGTQPRLSGTASTHSEWTSQPGAAYFRRVAQIGAQVGEALEYAHGEGVLHRDIKPSNLLLDTTGRVWVTDFGLAKADETDELTDPGDIVGTLCYMAPERLRGRADARSDVYGLGITLYECLTLQPAFADSQRARLIERVTREEPRRPRKLDPQIPRDLETIVLKAVAKEPKDRYQSAGGLADDLHRFLGDRPIQARRTPLRERAWRWCRRNPILALTTSLAAISLGTVAVLSIVLAVHQFHAAARAQEQWRLDQEAAARLQTAFAEAETQRRRAERSMTNLALDKAVNLCEQGDVPLGLLSLAYSLRIAPGDAPELQQVIRANLDGWRGELHAIRALLSQGESVTTLAYSPDGQTILTGGWHPEARLWNARTGQPLGRLRHGEGVRSVAFRPAGRLAVTLGYQGQVQLWDLTAPKPTGRPLRARADVTAICFAGDGKTLLTADVTGKLQRWNTSTGDFLGELFSYCGPIWCLALSPDGRTVLTGGDGETARLWNAADGRPRGQLLHRSAIAALVWNHDGKRLLTVTQDGTAQIWDAATQKPLGSPLQHRGKITAAVFSPNDKLILTGSVDGTAQLWDAITPKPLGFPLQNRGRVVAVAFNPDGQSIATAGTENFARLWDLKALGRTPVTLRQGTGWIRSLAFSPDGRYLLASSDDRGAWLWDLATQHAVGEPLRHQGRMRALAFHPDGSKLVTASLDERTAQFWERGTGRPIGAPLLCDSSVWAVAFSPDGRTLLTSDDDGNIQRWDSRRRTRQGEPLRHPPAALAVAWSPDGRRILTAGLDETARLWDAVTGAAIGQPLRHGGAVWAAAFSPDGKLLVTGSWDGTARLWDAASGQPHGGPLPHLAKVEAVAFSPDGKTVVTGSLNGQGRLWDVATGKPIGPPLTHEDMLLTVAFHPDGRTVATAGADGNVHLWPVPSAAQGTVEEVTGQMELLTGMHLETDGAAIMSSSGHPSR
jgi:WD40 repeat protein/serine/threonine protein kinase